MPYRILFLIFSLAILFPFSQGGCDENNPVRVEIISATQALGDQETVLMGVRFTPESGWRLYAPPSSLKETSPDELVRHPVFNWHGSKNLHEVHLHWGEASLIDDGFGKQALGYATPFVLPMTVNVLDPSKPLYLKAEVSFIACSTLCVPVTQTLHFTLEKGEPLPTSEANNLLAIRNAEIPADSQSLTLLMALVFAFLGGLILNFMPCVLPVLSLKLKGLTQIGTLKNTWRLQMMATILGILVSFIVIALLAISIEQSGEIFGWGLHFQSPAFLIFMLTLMFLFASTLWQGQSLSLPTSLQQKLSQILGGHATSHQIFYEHFLTGMFATLLATPCTAPFLGTALGYALSHGPFEIFWLFLLMGVGFALPYLLLLMLPPEKIWLPKPGPWMEKISKLFALMLAGTGLWLLWVLEKSVSFIEFILILTFVLLGVKLLLTTGARKSFKWGGVLILCIAFFLPQTDETLEALHLPSSTSSRWQPFNLEKIQHAVTSGEVVLVDVTASWCVTCAVNKKLVLDSGDLIQILDQNKVRTFRGDWTKPNKGIAQYLKSFNRHGIPFNAVYGPKAPQGIPLPELLTLHDVYNAIKKAS